MRRRKRKEILEENQSGPNRFLLFLQKTGVNTIFITVTLCYLLMLGIVCLAIKLPAENKVYNLQTKIQSETYKDVGSISEIADATYPAGDNHSQAEDIKNAVNGILSRKILDVVIIQSDPASGYKIISSTINETYKDNLQEIINNPKMDLRDYKILKYENEDIKKSQGKYKTIAIAKGTKTICLITLNTDKNNHAISEFEGWIQNITAVGLVLSIIFSIIIWLIFKRPIDSLKDAFSRVSEGDIDAKTNFFSLSEFNEIQSAYNRMLDSMQALYSSLENEVANRTKDLKNANLELKNTQAMMIHSEKMKSLGELVAGIMHEINNPINFIYGNMVHLSNYSADLINIIEEYGKLDDTLSPENKENIQNLKSEVDYEFLKTDLPDLIKSCKEGADRAKNIIQDLKSFSRMEEVSAHKIDLNHELDLTLNILHNKIKNKAEIHKEIDANLPEIEAYGGQLNQVFMNILDNALGAIPDRGDIWIRIHQDKTGEKVCIEIEDNGEGMDEETMRKIFNPFFTTKPVGKGTGLGLSITYKIIKSHQGNINVKSKKGEGTKFLITLPTKIQVEQTEEEAGTINE